MQEILVPLDGSEAAEQILPLATEIAMKEGGRLRLLSVVDTGGLPVTVEGPEGPHLDELIRREQNQAVAYVSRVRERLRASGVATESEIAMGFPAMEIVQRAQAHKVDLIAMTTQGRSGLARWVLGSVADKVLRSAEVPVLVHHPRHGAVQGADLHTVIVPLDGTPEAQVALPVALSVARSLHLELLLMRVVPLDSLGFTGAPHANTELAAAITDEAQEYLRTMLEQVRGKGVDARSHLVVGDPASGILEIAAQTAGPLVVMSTHGRFGLTRSILGSVTDRVIRSGAIPVVVVRPPAPPGAK
jgi:nucleotide-binding universal stress UspA family protein